MTLGPFLGFLCYVLGTKLGGALLFRMCSKEQQAGSSRQQQVAAGSSRQQQAAAGSSRHQQRQQQAAAGSGRQRQAAAKLQF